MPLNHKMTRLLLCGVFLTLLIPGVQSIPPTQDATEDAPNVVDEPNNVRYNELYPGERDHKYLDFTAAWLAYVNETDAVVLTLKGPDYTQFAEPMADDVRVECWISTEIKLREEGQKVPLLFRFRNNFGGASFDHSANITRKPGEIIEVKHTFETSFTAPGYVQWILERETLLKFGDYLETMMVACTEDYSPGGVVDPTVPVAGLVRVFSNSPITNYNPSRSGALTFNFTDFNRTNMAEEDPEPHLGVESASPAGLENTPALGVAAVVGVIVLAALGFARPRN
jgi:hypothetical protein